MPTIEFLNSKGHPVEAPSCVASVADTHAHLDMLADPALALARCAASRLDFVVDIVDPSENTRAYHEAEAWQRGARQRLDAWQLIDLSALDGTEPSMLDVPRLRMLCGVHPHNAKRYTPSCELRLMRCAADPRTAGIGEIGLDYHYNFSPRELQREAFARQLDLAHRVELPVSLHVREAHAEALEILRQEGVPRAGCVLHCFNLDYEALRPFLDLGCYVAFGGPLTFKKSHETREAATRVPVSRLLTETDAPYMTPEPLRGTTCSPEDTIFTAQRLYEVMAAAWPEHADKARFLNRIYDNALRIFDRHPSTWQLDEARQKALMSKAAGCVTEAQSAALCQRYRDEEA